MSSEALPPDPAPSDPEQEFAARLDRLEHVLRDELTRQRRRAEQAEAQLRAFGNLDEQAEELVSAARAEARKVLEAARHELDQAALSRAEADETLREAHRQADQSARSIRLTVPGRTEAELSGVDQELLVALRDHLIDTGALQIQMMAETRNAVIRLIQSSSQVRGGTVLRPVPSGTPRRQAHQ